MLQNKLVCRLKHEHTQQHLLSEGGMLLLEKVIDIVKAMVSVLSNCCWSNQEHLENFHKVQSNENLTCYHCEGRPLSQNCPLKDKECFFCYEKGHIMKVCKAKKKNSSIQRKANLVQALNYNTNKNKM